MKTKKTVVRGVAIVTALLMTGIASADAGHDKCVYSADQADITRHITELATYIANSKDFVVNKKFGTSADQEGLEAKAWAAKSKSLEEKYGDAMVKLEEIAAKVVDLVNAPKPKLSDEAGDDILYLNEMAYKCVMDVQLERL